MSWNLLGAIGAFCILSLLGAKAEDCIKAVLNRREAYYIVFGESLSLSCIVQHCGDRYTSKWIRKNLTDDTFSSVSITDRHILTSAYLSTNETRFMLDLKRVNESDEGFYACKVEWSSAEVDQGHLMYVNVTAVVSTERKVLYRILICFGVALCLAVALGLVFCLRSKVSGQTSHRKFTPVTSPCPMSHPSAEHQAPLHQSTPQPAPRRYASQKLSTSTEKVQNQPKKETEVLYADISQEALQRKQRVKPTEQQPSIYSSIRFS